VGVPVAEATGMRTGTLHRHHRPIPPTARHNPNATSPPCHVWRQTLRQTNQTHLQCSGQSMNWIAAAIHIGRTRRHQNAEPSHSRSNRTGLIEIGVLRSVLITPNQPLQTAVEDSREQGGPTVVAEKWSPTIDDRSIHHHAASATRLACGCRSWRYVTARCACAAAEKIKRLSFERTLSQFDR